MTDLPPKMGQRTVGGLVPMRRTIGVDGSPAGISPRPFGSEAAVDRALADGSLPVLGAFKQFLDKERRRTRRMIAGVSMLFLVVILGVAAASVYIGREHLARLRLDVGASREAALRVDERVDAVRGDLVAQSKRLEQSLSEGISKVTAMREGVIVLSSGLTNAAGRIEGLRSMMEQMEMESALSVGEMESRYQSISNRLAELMRENEAMSEELGRIQEKKVASAELPVPIPESIPMQLTPSNSIESVEWRLPDPS